MDDVAAAVAAVVVRVLKEPPRRHEWGWRMVLLALLDSESLSAGVTSTPRFSIVADSLDLALLPLLIALDAAL